MSRIVMRVLVLSSSSSAGKLFSSEGELSDYNTLLGVDRPPHSQQMSRSLRVLKTCLLSNYT